MTVMGYKRNDFTTKDGNHVTGYNLFLGYPISGADSDGMAVERLYFSDGKLAKCNYVPHVGDEVTVSYNRFGKPEFIIPNDR